MHQSSKYFKNSYMSEFQYIAGLVIPLFWQSKYTKNSVMSEIPIHWNSNSSEIPIGENSYNSHLLEILIIENFSNSDASEFQHIRDSSVSKIPVHWKFLWISNSDVLEILMHLNSDTSEVTVHWKLWCVRNYNNQIFCVHFSYGCSIRTFVDSLNSTPYCCSRLDFIWPQLDFFRSEEKPNVLCYILVLRCSMAMLWIQSLPSMPCGFVWMSIGWNRLSMSTEGCSVCMSIVIINFKVRVLIRTLSNIWWRL